MLRFLLSIFCLSILPPVYCFAGARHFTFIYEAPTSAPGSFESQNWVTWLRTTNPQRADQVAFRQEIEIGVTDRLQASIYLADWFYENDPAHSGFTYSDSAIELIYNLTNPVIDPIGLSVYQEYKGGDRLFEWESKLIAQRNLGPLILAYNATLEAVWEGKRLTEREGEFQQQSAQVTNFRRESQSALSSCTNLFFPIGATTKKLEMFSSARTLHIGIGTGSSRSRLWRRQPTRRTKRIFNCAQFSALACDEELVDLRSDWLPAW
jgi:hypothetical protein